MKSLEKHCRMQMVPGINRRSKVCPISVHILFELIHDFEPMITKLSRDCSKSENVPHTVHGKLRTSKFWKNYSWTVCGQWRATIAATMPYWTNCGIFQCQFQSSKCLAVGRYMKNSVKYWKLTGPSPRAAVNLFTWFCCWQGNLWCCICTASLLSSTNITSVAWNTWPSLSAVITPAVKAVAEFVSW